MKFWDSHWTCVSLLLWVSYDTVIHNVMRSTLQYNHCTKKYSTVHQLVKSLLSLLCFNCVSLSLNLSQTFTTIANFGWTKFLSTWLNLGNCSLYFMYHWIKSISIFSHLSLYVLLTVFSFGVGCLTCCVLVTDSRSWVYFLANFSHTWVMNLTKTQK